MKKLNDSLAVLMLVRELVESGVDRRVVLREFRSLVSLLVLDYPSLMEDGEDKLLFGLNREVVRMGSKFGYDFSSDLVC